VIDDLEAHIVCPICDTVDSVFLFHPADYFGASAPSGLGVVRCKACGLVRLDPRMKEESVAKVYQGGYWQLDIQGQDMRQFVHRSYRDRVRFLQRVSEPGRILDVGCGHGGYVWLLREMGWDAQGIDSYAGAAEWAETLFGLEISVGPLSEAGYPDGYFHTVVMHHVLEHVYQPVEFMRDVTRILAEDGILIIEVPNGESCDFSLFKGFSYGLRIPKHVFFYSPQTLVALLRKVGNFEILRVHHFSGLHSAAYAREGFKRSLGELKRTILARGKQGSTQDEAPHGLGEHPTINRPEGLPKKLFLDACGAALARLGSSVRRGSVIVLAARKCSMENV
jgi:2-polyprenyl-3-methyl-5-hydroxy-6-metoxy-1,4-benzoquinol methylase